VVFADGMPALGDWLGRFALPSLLSIAATYAALRFALRRALRGEAALAVQAITLDAGGLIAAAGIAATVIVLMGASAFELRLGLPICIAGIVTLVAVLLWRRRSPVIYLRHISWGILPLVAGLFVLVEALDGAGLLRFLSREFATLAGGAPTQTASAVGVLVALVSNLVNNLPAGLLAGAAVHAAHSPPQIAGAVLIGIDLGPNLSVTGSLATILWLAALRREGEEVSAWRFLKLGCLVMPAALIPALAALLLAGG